jgi:hypothetical protein
MFLPNLRPPGSFLVVYQSQWSTDHWWSAAVHQVLSTSIAKTATDTERMKNTALHICAKTVFVTLATGMMFLLFTYMHFWM